MTQPIQHLPLPWLFLAPFWRTVFLPNLLFGTVHYARPERRSGGDPKAFQGGWEGTMTDTGS